jgi:hypothetical protein
MAALRNFSSADNLTAITDEPLELGIWNLVQRSIINTNDYKLSLNTVYKSSITNMAKMRNILVSLYATNLTNTKSALK